LQIILLNYLPSFQDVLQKQRKLFQRYQCLAIFALVTKCN